MSEEKLILVINPGSTSTKVGLFKDQNLEHESEIIHPPEKLSDFNSNLEQLDYRLGTVIDSMKAWNVKPEELAATIGRGGPLKPLEGGVYHVGKTLIDDLESGKLVDHASILGGLIACRIAQPNNIPAYIADPVSVDEFNEIARISGFPDLPRMSLSHALNIKAVVAEVAKDSEKKPEDMNYVVAHLGGGISIAAHEQGRQVDVNNANDAGPFSPERCGTLPLTGLLKLCFSGKYTQRELKKTLIGKGGLISYLGTPDCRKITKLIESGDSKAELVLKAMAYQIAKEIGAMATVMHGKVDAIILTGGVAHCKPVTDWITERVTFIAPVILKPGQNELKALANHALTALTHPAIVKEY
jgi:butyrate kinase